MNLIKNFKKEVKIFRHLTNYKSTFSTWSKLDSFTKVNFRFYLFISTIFSLIFLIINKILFFLFLVGAIIFLLNRIGFSISFYEEGIKIEKFYFGLIFKKMIISYDEIQEINVIRNNFASNKVDIIIILTNNLIVSLKSINFQNINRIKNNTSFENIKLIENNVSFHNKAIFHNNVNVDTWDRKLEIPKHRLSSILILGYLFILGLSIIKPFLFIFIIALLIFQYTLTQGNLIIYNKGIELIVRNYKRKVIKTIFLKYDDVSSLKIIGARHQTNTASLFIQSKDKKIKEVIGIFNLIRLEKHLNELYKEYSHLRQGTFSNSNNKSAFFKKI